MIRLPGSAVAATDAETSTNCGYSRVSKTRDQPADTPRFAPGRTPSFGFGSPPRRAPFITSEKAGAGRGIRTSGGRGIRTHDDVAAIAVFKTAALGHYASPPRLQSHCAARRRDGRRRRSTASGHHRQVGSEADERITDGEAHLHRGPGRRIRPRHPRWSAVTCTDPFNPLTYRGHVMTAANCVLCIVTHCARGRRTSCRSASICPPPVR